MELQNQKQPPKLANGYYSKRVIGGRVTVAGEIYQIPGADLDLNNAYIFVNGFDIYLAGKTGELVCKLEKIRKWVH